MRVGGRLCTGQSLAGLPPEVSFRLTEVDIREAHLGRQAPGLRWRHERLDRHRGRSLPVRHGRFGPGQHPAGVAIPRSMVETRRGHTVPSALQPLNVILGLVLGIGALGYDIATLIS